MSPEIVFLIGTLTLWLGWFSVFRTVALGLRSVLGAPESASSTTQKQVVSSALLSGVLLIVGSVLPIQSGRPAVEGIRIPMVWVLMPFMGWLVVISIIGLAIRLIQASLAINAEERRARLSAAGIWIAVGIFAIWQYKGRGMEAQIFRGVLPISIQVAVGLSALVVASLGLTALMSRSLSTRGISKKIITHAALVLGTLVFGIPFAWLLVTSFKEDKDIVSADGLKWIPYVTETVPYSDPRDPQYQGTFQNQSVTGTVLEKNNGEIKLDIQRPMAMRGMTFSASESELKLVPKDVPVVTGTFDGRAIKGFVAQETSDAKRLVQITEPEDLKGTEYIAEKTDVAEVRNVGLRVANYTDALDFLPPETAKGLVYLRNTLILVIMSVIGVLVSCTLVAYGFSRLQFPGKNTLFWVLLSTMMLPGAVTMLPKFLLFRSFGWIDTLYPLWVPTFTAGAFNVFLLRQFFSTIPMELEDAAKIDGCNYAKTLWSVMVPQIKPALAAIAIWTTMGAWNNFMEPLIYLSTPEKMPLAYALQLYNSDRGGEPGMLMAFSTLTMLPVLILFFFAQKYFIEGVTLSGLGGR